MAVPPKSTGQGVREKEGVGEDRGRQARLWGDLRKALKPLLPHQRRGSGQKVRRVKRKLDEIMVG